MERALPRYTDGYWSSDGLRLHYRDYPGGADRRPVVLCLPGLTRSARDFAPLAEQLSPAWRVIAVSFRGRGGSEYSRDSATYVPPTYARDVAVLLDDLAPDGVVAIGTSLGGLVAMLMAGDARGRLKGLVLNDVGPELETAGIARIRSYVGRGGAWPTWLHAARSLADLHRAAYPDYALEDWLRMAKRLYRLSGNGRITQDYDARIAEPMRSAAGQEPVDLWPMLEPLRDVPTLILRGELSDVLGTATVERMLTALSYAEAVTVPRVGHAPALDEPEAVEGIERLLARVLVA